MKPHEKLFYDDFSKVLEFILLRHPWIIILVAIGVSWIFFSWYGLTFP